MIQLKVIIVGTSPAETLRLEEALQQTGCLDSFRFISLDQALERVPDWDECHLLIARYQESSGASLLSLLAPVLRQSNPAVFFLVNLFEPLLVSRLFNAGARRVMPLECLEQVLGPALSAVFQTQPPQPKKSLIYPTSYGVEAWDAGSPEIKIAEGRSQYAAPEEGKNNAAHILSAGLDGKNLNAFEDIFRTSPSGFSINRLRDGVCIACNESLARLLEWPQEDLMGRSLPELGLSEVIENYFQLEGAARDPDHQTVTLERKVYTRSRQIRHVQIHVHMLEWGGETCLLSLVQDVTDREQAKEKIKRLNDELERLILVRTGALEAANRELAAEIGRRKVLEDFSNQLSQIIWETPDVVAICDADGRMQFLNKAGRALFGLSEDESVGHLDFFSAYAPETRRWIREEIQPLVSRQGIWRGEAVLQVADGCVIPISQVLLCKKNEYGEVQFFASVARDVSDFKKVEHELLQSRERYRILAEAAHDFIFMASKDGVMEYANEYACQALGFDPNRVDGTPVNQFFPKDFSSNHLQMFSEVHEIDRPVYTEGPFFQEGQESAWMGTWLVPIHGEDGSLTSILGISRDITEQKKTDEALQRALQNERKLNEMRSNFFSMTSHQFRTPLSTILLSAELLQKYGAKWDDQKRLEHLARIQEAARRLNSMLEDILVIGRVESGRYVCSPKEFDLVGFCAQVIRDMALNDHNEHPIAFEHEAGYMMVYHDGEVMQRVIDNLLSNAIKYSPKGTCVTVKISSEGQSVILEVTDHGIGIPERDLKYLFQPFQRGSNAVDFPGTGIGLTIIQKSVELMNGTISLKSKEGSGTTFMVRFPIRFEAIDDQMSV